MDNFVQYIKNLKGQANELDKYETVHIVIGNESCDLDSTVSALSLAFFLNINNNDKNSAVLPVMNVNKDEFLLRTENCYCLKKVGVDLAWILYCNDVDYNKIVPKLKITLVDHHVLSGKNEILRNSVVEIFDHRPFDSSSNWKTNVLLHIEPVGSCSTLIAHKILQTDKSVLTENLATLLYETINFDTIGFKPEAGKTKDLDLKVAEELETFLKINKDRLTIFDELWTVHNDVSHLSAKQLLSKDLKTINSVFIPGLPMLVRKYLQMPDVITTLKEYINDNKCSVLVLMGLEAKNCVQRDLAIYSLNNCNLKTKIKESLLSFKMLDLQEEDLNITGMSYFVQGNNKASRKQILPIIKAVLT